MLAIQPTTVSQSASPDSLVNSTCLLGGLLASFFHMLFQKNFENLLAINPKIKEFEAELLKLKDNIASKKSLEQLQSEFTTWLEKPDNIVRLPGLIPSKAERRAEWLDLWGEFTDQPSDPSCYLEIHEDTHVYQFINSYIRFLEANDIPLEKIYPITVGCNSLVICGTGDGQFIKFLIDTLKPYSLIIAVHDWSEFVSSFHHVDWLEVWSQFSSEGKNIQILKVKDKTEILAKLKEPSLLSLEFAYVYVDPDASDQLQEESKVLSSDLVFHTINYLGYTVDEYNMIVNTFRTLYRQPKTYLVPRLPAKGRAIVCASGPSLDTDLETIKKLSLNSAIIASASSIRSLLRNGIRVDALVLIERGFDVYEAYKDLADEFDLSDVILFTSTTCDCNLSSLFKKRVCFFRSALTPLAVFSDTVRELLPNDGPEAVNAATSLACTLGFEEINFFGVDLGSADTKVERSKDAVAFTYRTWDLEEDGNKDKLIHTNQAMLDVQTVLGRTIMMYPKISFYNWSDGLLINGATPILSMNDYLEASSFNITSISEKNTNFLDEYYNRLPSYLPGRVKSSWEAKNLRQTTYEVCSQLKTLLNSNINWFPDLIIKLEKIMTLECNLERQFPRRIIRGSIYKAFLLVTQTMFVSKGLSLEIQQTVLKESKELLLKLVKRLELEIYSICDFVENE